MNTHEPIVRHVEGRRADGSTVSTVRIIHSHDWPTREEWAENERTWRRYIGDDEVHVSGKVSDYMERYEIDALVANLNARRAQLGKELREAKKRCPQVFRQKDETLTQWNNRWYRLSKEEQEFDVWTWPRQQIFQAIKLLKEDRIPIYGDDGGFLPEVRELQERRQAAYEAEENRIEAEYAARPIDDEAWAKELARRSEIERVDALPDSEWIIQATR